MTDKTQDLRELLSLSRVMLAKARQELWDDVITLQAERDELIGRFFLAPVPEHYASSVAEGIESILSIDGEIMELGELKRFDIAQALQDMDQGKKAVKAYTS